MKQALLFSQPLRQNLIKPFRLQLLKWVGNKQRFAHEIVSYFPRRFGTYFEPFLGSGGVLGSLVPTKAIASDSFQPLMEIWRTLNMEPATLKRWYEERWDQLQHGNKEAIYEQIKASYNSRPNGADLLFICRACYGGVVRFRQADGYISTPVGIHDPISPRSLSERVDTWHERTKGTEFLRMEYEESMDMAKTGDMIYCDPPYSHTQAILYGAQSFSLEHLFRVIEKCKRRGVHVALSIDGSKKSGATPCNLPIPKNLFEREVFINIGRSMLKRFQMNGASLEKEVVADRLLLTY